MKITAKSSVGYPPTRSKSRENRYFIFSVFHKKHLEPKVGSE